MAITGEQQDALIAAAQNAPSGLSLETFVAYLRQQVPNLSVDDSYLAGYWSLYRYPGSYGPPAPTPTPAPPAEPPPGGTIFDTIINWIKEVISGVGKILIGVGKAVWDFIASPLVTLWNNALALINGWIDAVKTTAADIWDWAVKTYNAVIDWKNTAWATIVGAVSSVINPIYKWWEGLRDDILAWVSFEFGKLTAGLAIEWANITTWFQNLQKTIGSYSDWLTVWLPKTVGDILSGWWDSFLARVFDFSSWVSRLGNAVWTYLMHDVPGSSPFLGAVIAAVMGLLSSYLIVKFPEQIGSVGTKLIDTVITATEPVAKVLMGMVDTFVSRLTAATSTMGAVAPGDALGMSTKLVQTGATVVTGLIGMTFAGELTMAGSKLGLGNISAMIYDLTNYKVLTGAFVGALAYAAIQTPLRYYYQNTFRPRLPSEGDASALFARDRITSAEYRQLLGYAGYADRWHDDFADLAYRPMSLVALSTLCTSGGFDESMVTQVLVDRGINPKWRPAMLDLYRRKGQDMIKGIMSSVPITRFKQGYTDGGTFRDEMSLLGYTDQEIAHYQAAASLSYATDYINDLISAWQAQVRKKVMSLTDYRAKLGTVIMVPERIDAMVIKEIVSAPVEEPKAAGISIAVTRYSTGETTEAQFRDELTLLGCPAIDIDRNVAAAGLVYAHDYTLDLKTAYTDAVRANNLTLDEFRQALLGIGLVPERVEGLVLIERARLKPKQALTPTSPAAAYYNTDVGKVTVDTIRRRRRKGAITRDEEIAALIATGYEPTEATVITENDDVRLAEKPAAS